MALKIGRITNAKIRLLTRFLPVFVLAASASAQLQFAFSQAGGYPGPYGTITDPFAANLTQIAGYYTEPSSGSQGYIQTGTKFVTAQPHGVGSSYLSGINNRGIAAGGYCARGCNTQSGQHGYTYDSANGVITMIDYPGAGATTANGVNDKGQIVGGFCASTIACPVLGGSVADHGFLYSNGVFTQLDFPGAESTQPNAINNAGVIVGVYIINSTGPHGFMYSNGTYTNIDFPGAGTTYALAINNLGVVAGSHDGFAGFLYSKGKFQSVSVPNVIATGLFGINDHNDIVGFVATTGMPGNATFKGVPKK